VCFVVYWIPEGFGIQKMSYKSVICDGKLEQITDPEGIKSAVRNSEKNLGLPEGAWDNLLEMTLKNLENSYFWKINVTNIGGQSV
jgi:nitroimidazol reductase NimA-like FMN-containing flavoprotein (pyridoxamine 5'-phosphate oxidase superfamily)